jgi:hypothetical protein
MLCPECGAQIEDGQEICSECRAQIRKPGLLRRLRDFFSKSTPTPVITTQKIEHLAFVDATTGKRQVFNSFKEVPPEIQAKIEEALAQDKIISKSSSFTFRGPDGHERVFHSLDEMPPDVRAFYERLVLPGMPVEARVLAAELEPPNNRPLSEERGMR